MSGQPFGSPPSSPYQTPQTGASTGDSPELLSRANSAFNLALGALAITFFCCCGLGGLIMGVIAMNNASSVLALAPAGSEANAKASTAKMLGIIAIVLAIIHMIGLGGAGVVSNMGR